MSKLSTFALMAAISLFLMSCGEHTFDDFLEDIFGSSSSEGEEELLSSSSAARSSSSSSIGGGGSSSAARSSSSAGQSSSSSADLSGGGAGVLTIQDRQNGQYITSDGRMIKLYYSLPPSVNKETKVLVVLPGTGRNAPPMVNDISKFAENVIVLGLIYDADDFPGYQYDLANISSDGTINGSIMPYSEWSFHYIDGIYEQFAAHYELSARTYILYGFSAGASFAERAYLFSNSPYLDYVIIGGLSTITYLRENNSYPNGIKTLLQHKGMLLDNLANKRLYVLIGSDDAARYDRNINFYETAHDYAEQQGIELNWEFKAFEGVGHDPYPMTPSILNILATGSAYNNGDNQ